MATNENGNLVDDKGNVVVEFVWGNIPMQPNDVREENGGGLLDATLDNHSIAYEGWNGYPLYDPNTEGPEGAGYIVVPSVIGLLTADAVDVLEDAGLVVTTAAAATNAAKTVTAISRAAGQTTTIFDSTAHGFVVGQQIVISNSGSAAANGTYTITDKADNWIEATGTSTTVLDLSDITASLVGKSGTIKTQSVAAGANEKEVGDAITITPFATAS
jgi:hypothetical protein